MKPSTLIKILWTWGVVLSIGMSFYIMIYQTDFMILKNPDGMPELDEE